MTGKTMIAEMKEFATFPKGTQRYIRRSLEVARKEPGVSERWARNRLEEMAISEQAQCYDRHLPVDPSPEPKIENFIEMAILDLRHERVPHFAAFRFLYERLLGASMRPWLPMIYVAASASPEIKPSQRRTLLQNISEAAATTDQWSKDEPEFYPEWVEKVEPTTNTGTTK